MKITKFGHCCLLLETKGKRILVDPGRFSDSQNELTDIDIVLITHEHGDHCHTESVQKIVEKNSDVVIVTNTSVANLLRSLSIDVYVLEGRDAATITDVALEAFDGPHVEIFESFGIVQNTGYFVENHFFFPGDAYTIPHKPVTVLALPVAGPWCKASDAVHYALKVNPKVAIPVHDATLSAEGIEVTYGLFDRELSKHNIVFTPIPLHEERSF